MIRPLTLQESKSSAHLHASGMPEDFLSSFGEQFLIKLHAGLIGSSSTIALGEFRNRKLVGIIIG
ncbi:MAG: hypothetical protein UV55_C0003G0001, partial [Candidatus Gottesmanbacteria bacterium GW2011_GWC1_43_10]